MCRDCGNYEPPLFFIEDADGRFHFDQSVVVIFFDKTIILIDGNPSKAREKPHKSNLNENFIKWIDPNNRDSAYINRDHITKVSKTYIHVSFGENQLYEFPIDHRTNIK